MKSNAGTITWEREDCNGEKVSRREGKMNKIEGIERGFRRSDKRKKK